MEPELILPDDLADAAERLDQLVKSFEEHPDVAVQERVFEVLQCVDRLHRPGLRCLGELLKVAGLQQRALDDPEVRLLFDLYDLGEGGEHSRANAVLLALRPGLQAYGAEVTLVEATANDVAVRLSLPAQAAESAATLRDAVEQTLRDALPGVGHVGVTLVAPAPPVSNFVPLSSLVVPKRTTLTWQSVLSADALEPDALRGLMLDGDSVLLARVDDEYFAYRNACPGTPFPLDAAHVAGGVLTCPWHGCEFSLRGGQRKNNTGPGLGVIPVRVEDGEVRIGQMRVAA